MSNLQPYPLVSVLSNSNITSTVDGVKVATPDIILFDADSVPIEVMTDLLFEDIGGQEIINIVRNDIINGQNVIYTPIKNLSAISYEYNSKNIIPMPQTQEKFFNNFSYRLANFLPEIGEGTGPNGETVYIDNNGDLVINVINTSLTDEVEVQIIATSETIDGTIY